MHHDDDDEDDEYLDELVRPLGGGSGRTRLPSVPGGIPGYQAFDPEDIARRAKG